MTSKTETALIALVAVLDRAFGPESFPAVNRNEALEDILSSFGDGEGGGYANLVDGQGEIVDTMLGAAMVPEVTGYEIAHHAGLELFVCIAEQKQRDATMDSMLEIAAGAIEADRTLGGVVDFTEFEAPARDNYKQDGLPIIKGATFTVTMTFQSPRPF